MNDKNKSPALPNTDKGFLQHSKGKLISTNFLESLQDFQSFSIMLNAKLGVPISIKLKMKLPFWIFQQCFCSWINKIHKKWNTICRELNK